MQEVKDFWSKKETDVLKELETSKEGLSYREVELRKNKYGSNLLKKEDTFFHFYSDNSKVLLSGS